MTPALWVAVAVIGAVTLVARVLPLLRRGPMPAASTTAPGWLNALGPCLLTAMGVAVLFPEAIAAWAMGNEFAFLLGAGAAVLALLLRRDPGLAALAGVLGWWLGSTYVVP